MGILVPSERMRTSSASEWHVALLMQRCGADTYIPASALEKVRTLGKGSFSLGERLQPAPAAMLLA